MKKKGILSLALIAILCGCSCSNVNENTYNNAVSNFNSSDAISFTRIEKVEENNNPSSYSTTQVTGTFVFDTNRNGSVLDAKYVIEKSKGTTPISTHEYYYNSDAATLYLKKNIHSDSVTTTREPMAYDEYFNNSNCDDTACRIAMPTNIAPIYTIEDVQNFVITQEGEEAIATYNAACPYYENCKKGAVINYRVIIGGSGDIVGLYYTIQGDTTTTTISYSFTKYGSNEISIIFPNELEHYKPGKIE